MNRQEDIRSQSAAVLLHRVWGYSNRKEVQKFNKAVTSTTLQILTTQITWVTGSPGGTVSGEQKHVELTTSQKTKGPPAGPNITQEAAHKAGPG